MSKRFARVVLLNLLTCWILCLVGYLAPLNLLTRLDRLSRLDLFTRRISSLGHHVTEWMCWLVGSLDYKALLTQEELIFADRSAQVSIKKLQSFDLAHTSDLKLQCGKPAFQWNLKVNIVRNGTNVNPLNVCFSQFFYEMFWQLWKGTSAVYRL